MLKNRIVRLRFLLVLLGIFSLNCMYAKVDFMPSSIDTTKQEKTWFDKNDTIEFFPVCGSDSHTYLNPTEALSFGVTSWTEGSCHTYEEILSIEPDAFWIEEISLNEASNVSLSNPVGFSDHTNVVLEVYKNKENKFFYKSNAFDRQIEGEISIWIDFNKNGFFEKSELLGKENIMNSEGYIPFQISSSIEANLVTRMRIICSTSKEFTILSKFIDKGEVEDYTVIVVE